MSGQLGRIYQMTLAQADLLIVVPESSQFGDEVYLTDGYAGNGPGLYLKQFDSTYTPVVSASSKGLSKFATFVQRVTDVAATIAANNGKALFHSGAPENTAGLTTVADSGDIVVGVGAGGKYAFNFQVAGAEPNAFGLFVNGLVVARSVFGSGAGTQQNNGFGLVTLADGDTVSLRTVNCAAAITLQLAGTTDVEQVCCALRLEKIG